MIRIGAWLEAGVLLLFAYVVVQIHPSTQSTGWSLLGLCLGSFLLDIWFNRVEKTVLPLRRAQAGSGTVCSVTALLVAAYLADHQALYIALYAILVSSMFFLLLLSCEYHPLLAVLGALLIQYTLSGSWVTVGCVVGLLGLCTATSLLPLSFTIGEGLLLATLLAISVENFLLEPEAAFVVVIHPLIQVAVPLLLVSLVGCGLLYLVYAQDRRNRNTRSNLFVVFYPVLGCVIGMGYSTCSYMLDTEPITRLGKFILQENPASITVLYVLTPRQAILILWSCVLFSTIVLFPPTTKTIHHKNRNTNNKKQAVFITRKFYHGVITIMFVPAVYLDAHFVAFASLGMLTMFLLLACIAGTEVWPCGRQVSLFLRQFLAARDSGVVVFAHIYLLLGCAFPLWFHLCFDDNLAVDLPGYWLRISGVVVLGVGDSLASFVGVKYGRIHWWTGGAKTLAGTVAMFLSILGSLALLALVYNPLTPAMVDPGTVQSWSWWGHMALACAFIALVEAWSTQVDNLLLPILFYSAAILAGSSANPVALT